MYERAEAEREPEASGPAQRRSRAVANPYPTGEDEQESRHLLGHEQRRIKDEPRINGAQNAGRARVRGGQLVTRESVGEHDQESAGDGVEDGGDVWPRAEKFIACRQQTAVADRPMTPGMP